MPKPIPTALKLGRTIPREGLYGSYAERRFRRCRCGELPPGLLLALTRRLAADAERLRGAQMVHDLATAVSEHLQDSGLGGDTAPPAPPTLLSPGQPLA